MASKHPTAAGLAGAREGHAKIPSELMNRWRDWWDQAERDVRHARHAVEDTDHEWSAFAAQQAAEKALEALILSQGPLPCPIDLFVLTAEEIEQHAGDGHPLLREALTHGRDLL
jgi:hypothetical protein